MFYVYDIDGLRFRGPMEALEQARKVTRRVPVPPLKEGRAPLAYPESGSGGSVPANTAVAAYLRTMNRENLVEPLVHIYQIMTSPVTTVGGDVPLVEAWQTLGRLEIRQLVVVSERNLVMGMLSDRDILRRLNVIDGEVEIEMALTVSDVMQQEVISTDSISDIRRVARVMAFHHAEAMPVTSSEGNLIGIVTRGDILRSFAENPRLNLWA